MLKTNTAMETMCARSVVSNSLQPRGLQPARLLCPWDSPARILEWAAISPPRDPPDPGVRPASPASPALQAGSSPAEPSGKPSIAFEEGPEVLDFVYGLNYYHFVLLDCLSFLLQLLTF